MEGGPAPAPREQGWARVVLALAALLLVPLVPMARAVLPVDNTIVLLLPALAACFIVGWRAGGSLVLAITWTAMTIWLLTIPARAGGMGFHDMVRAWTLLAAGSFGLSVLLGPARTFFPRALSAVGIAMTLALLLVLSRDVSLERARDLVSEQFQLRVTEMTRAVRAGPAIFPAAQARAEEYLALLPRMAELATPLFPAVLALQSLAAMALAWALYHRLSRTRLGPPLAPLREFRFNDQLVWGLVVGVTLAVLPTLEGLRPVGLNLLVFFGGLFVVRGFAVMSWHLTPLGGVIRAVVWIVALVAWPITTVVAFTLGLNDTWFDLRRRGPTDRWTGRPQSLL